MPDALELLTTRRSFKAVELVGPAPSEAEIDTLLTVASRVPDHGKLAPWRFIVLATLTSRTTLPVSSTMQTLVALTETSSPAKWSMLRFSF